MKPEGSALGSPLHRLKCEAPCDTRDVPLHPRPQPPDRAARRAGADRVPAGSAGSCIARSAGPAEGEGSGDPVHLQPDRSLRPRVRAGARGALAGRLPSRPEGHAAALHLHAAAGKGDHPRLPRGERPRLDGAGRAADPGPDEAGGAPRRIGGRAGTGAEPALPAHVRRGQGCAHANRHRHRVDLDGGRLRQARRAASFHRSRNSGCC